MRKRERHGDSQSKLFKVWGSMRYRCLPRWKGREYYYDRGITVCEEWQKYTVFKAWAMDNGYQEGLDLDRIDNNNGYSPSNCRFVPRIINTSNRTNTVVVDYEGERVSLTLLAIRLNWPTNKYHAIRRRIKNGWSDYRAIETPIRNGNFHHPKFREVLHLESGKIFKSVNAAAKFIGVSSNHLSQVLSGKRENRVGMAYTD